jgi:tetratricopeptide (TPR) repeat protein
VEKWPLFLMAGASGAVTYLVQQAGGAVQSIGHLPLGMRLANAVVATVWYLRAWTWPVDLAVYYPQPGAGHSAVAVGGSLAVLLLLAAGAAWAWRRGWKSWGVGWLWFLGTLVPMIGLVQVGGQAWADRYSYLPHVGLTVALTWGVGEISRVNAPGGNKAKACLGLLMLGLVLGLALLSRRQTTVWQNSETLFVRALQVTERNAMAHGALGFAYASDGRNIEAVDQLKRALEIQPGNLRALNNLSWIWATDPKAEPGQVEAAANLARRAMEQVRRAKAEGVSLEAGVETAVMDTLEKAESRKNSTVP